MLDPATVTPLPLREDIVVSVCFADLAPSPAAFDAVRALAERLDAVYRFREIILVVEDSMREAFLPLVEDVRELRLFVVGPASDYYERRVIAAEEAIGDLVLIGAADEIGQIDALAFLDHTEAVDAVTLATRERHSRLTTALTLPIIAIGRLAGFKVNLNDLQTIAMPRTALNQLLAHEEPRLALRFPPRDPRVPFNCLRIDARRIARSRATGLARRLQLLQTLLVYLAPTILSLVALASSLLALLGLAFAAYVVGAFLLVDDLAPGWLTTSAMLTVSAVFMGVSMLGLSLGMSHVLRQIGRGGTARMAEEVNRIDLFGKVRNDLNVELESAER
jgi:hypothetical protein